MEKTTDRSRRTHSKRKFRFFTDSESEGRSAQYSESSQPRNVYASLPRNRQMKQGNKFRDIIRRNYKFLTQTQYSNPLYSQYEEQSCTPKRERSPLPHDRNAPQKKLKMNEDQQNNIKKDGQDELNFIKGYRQPKLNNKK